MLAVTIWGIPSDFKDAATLKELVEERIPKAVASLDGLSLEPREVSVFVPQELVSRRSEIDIIAFIDGLFTKPERTQTLQDSLASLVGGAIEHFVAATMPKRDVFVGVFVHSHHKMASGTALSTVKAVPTTVNNTVQFCERCNTRMVRNSNIWQCPSCGKVKVVQS